MWRSKRLALAVSALLATAAEGQDIDAIAAALASHPVIPGATVGWIEAGDLAWAVAGERISGSGDPVARGDLWHIGSLTKSMTATLAARLVTNGELSWDTSLAGGPSLEALLTHRSGFPANPGLLTLAFLNNDWEMAQSDTRAGMVDAAMARRRDHGEYLYSNLGYVAAGQMLADVRDTEWEALIAAELFAPLGLSTASFGPPGRMGGDAVWGHRANGRATDPTGNGADNRPAFGPAGTVHLSTEDMLHYLRAHLVRDPDLLPREAWDQLHSPPEGGDYALGWVLREDGSIWHNGSNTFWYAEAVVDHASGRAAFVAVNSGNMAVVQGPVSEALDALMAR